MSWDETTDASRWDEVTGATDGGRWDEATGGWDEDGDDGWPVPHQPLTWRGLSPTDRWRWFERLWDDVCMLRERYRLMVRTPWWSDERQLEVLAALAAWVGRYDTGEWDDPPGKLALLFDLERVRGALREGLDPFAPERDRDEFDAHLRALGCAPPAAADDRPPGGLPR